MLWTRKVADHLTQENAVVTEFKLLIRIHNLLDSWPQTNLKNPGFTWCNPSMQIQSRLDYFFVSKFLHKLIQECRVVPNVYSDHSALALTICFDDETICFDDETPPHGPDFWKFELFVG